VSMVPRTYEDILQSMLSCVDNAYDKREGSLIWSAVAPVAAELAAAYAFLADYLDLLLPDTAAAEYLDRLCAAAGIVRAPATNAVISAAFYDVDEAAFAVPIGSRFYAEGVYFVVQDEVSAGVYTLMAETAGVVGNLTSGELLAVDHVDGLARAEVISVYEFGAEAEDDESLRDRYVTFLAAPAFGGNISDYRLKALALEGVGAVAVFPTWNGGGTVFLTIGGDDERAVDADLVAAVQNIFMPQAENGLGTGIAPIGHSVTVGSAVDLPLDIVVRIVTEAGVTAESLQTKLEAALAAHIGSIGFEQEKLHISPFVVTVLAQSGVIDVQSITVNGSADTLELSKTAALYQVPVFGSLTVEVVS